MSAPSASADERRLVFVISAVMFLDTLLYAAIAPLLPGLAHELRLSKLSAGVMTASYPIGMLIGSLPGGVLAARAGPRFALCTGLTLLAASTIAFGFLNNAAALDVARFVEGLGGACSWAGGLAWLAAETPIERRGAMMGRAVGAGVGGALFGPVVGTVATAIGRPAAFGAVAVAAGLLIAATRRLVSHHVASEQGLGAMVAVLRQPRVALAMWLMALPAIAAGMTAVLGPLRLHRFGAPAAAIGATFIIAAAIEAMIAPVVGSLSDRRGRLTPLRYGLAVETVALCSFTLPDGAALLAVVIIVISGVMGAFWAPSMAMLADAAERHELDQGLAAALMNLAWAAGEVVGSVGGGALSKSAGDGLPMAIAAALCAATLAALAWAPMLPKRITFPSRDPLPRVNDRAEP
jgi:MFS family permease